MFTLEEKVNSTEILEKLKKNIFKHPFYLKLQKVYLLNF